MIDEIDEVLRQLLVRELPVKNGEIDIKFDQPKREWSGRLSRPTLNLFLHRIQENQKLRQTQPMWETRHNPDGSFSQRRKPVRVDLHYMITAWATDPEDEHRLLGRAISSLFRHEYLPSDMLPPSLQDQPVPIPIMIAKQDELQDTSLMWSAMDNEMRPSMACVITLAVNPYQFYETPLVRTRELIVGQSPTPPLRQLEPDAGIERFWTVGGRLRSRQPIHALRMVLVEQGLDIPLQTDGYFIVPHLRQGEYTLQITDDGQPARRFSIAVPSPDYELEI